MTKNNPTAVIAEDTLKGNSRRMRRAFERTSAMPGARECSQNNECMHDEK